jgi:anti-anti-sigma factor
MQLTVQESVAVVQVGNRINPTEFQQTFQQWVSQRHTHFAVDLSQLAFVDSSGLGMLVSAFKTIQQAQGKLVLFGLQPYVQKLVTITKLDRVLPIVPTQAEALEQLGASALTR